MHGGGSPRCHSHYAQIGGRADAMRGAPWAPLWSPKANAPSMAPHATADVVQWDREEGSRTPAIELWGCMWASPDLFARSKALWTPYKNTVIPS